jgi:hypothetical protein
MSRTKFRALLSTGLAALLVSACVMTPPPGQPVQAYPAEPPPAVAEPGYPAEPEPGYPADPASEMPPAQPVEAEPPPAHDTPPAPVADAPAYPPDGPRQHPGPRPTPGQRPHQQPGERPNEYVPSRRARLGDVANFTIEPTAGPVGTTITIYGDFTGVRNPTQISVSFAGTRRIARPVYVAGDRVAVVVPQGARTGAVVVTLRNRQAWSGRFAVTPRDNDLFLPTPVDSGLLGAVYRLPPNTERLPSFRGMGQPHATIVVPSLKVSPRRFDAGFPGLEDAGQPLLEWFAIRFVGRLWVPASGHYQFRINSDDGSRLFIDDRQVIDNDGVHPPRASEGGIELAAGSHEIVVEYFQGPRYEIALELSWRHGGRGWEIVPPQAFSRYTGGYACDSEPQVFCCQGNQPECRACRENARRATEEWRTHCTGVVPPPSQGPGPGPAPVDCSREPQRACCRANTPQCNQCQRDAADERAAWQRLCVGHGGPSHPAPSPGPAPVDCSREPQRACCRANTPQCNQCQRDAADERAAWARLCVGHGGPSHPAPSPGPAPVDCSREPQRACCRANTPQCNQCQRDADRERAEWQRLCVGQGAPSHPAPSPGPAPVDCSREPQRMCCRANTPQCNQCQRDADRERAEWQRLCVGQGAPSHPGPAPIDCAQEPQRMCCQSQSAQCQKCRQDAAAERAQWAQQCGGGQAPGKPGLDCGKEPQRMCCQSNTPQCQQCQRDAQDERREWQRLCGGGNIDCSKRPSRGCCKALTPQCTSCQQQAQAELERWQAACSR